VATFILIPGAGGMAWYWSRVVPLLQVAGHEAIAVDLPADDDRAGLAVYRDRVVKAIGGHRKPALVAQSLGGFTAPLVCERVPVRMLVLVNAMIPLPGERVGDWWNNTQSEAARNRAAKRGGYSTAFDLDTYFMHDVPANVVAEGGKHEREQSGAVFADRCEFKAWPEVSIHVIAGRDDRFLPLEFQKRIAKARLDARVDEVPGGHLVALANPRGLTDRLLGYL
jgi:pimeloyl-ACP methyl ester carboxylesterase